MTLLLRWLTMMVGAAAERRSRAGLHCNGPCGQPLQRRPARLRRSAASGEVLVLTLQESRWGVSIEFTHEVRVLFEPAMASYK